MPADEGGGAKSAGVDSLQPLQRLTLLSSDISGLVRPSR
mgnify:CR=1 FL=1|jgi:hypothetical protein